jgi:membrane-associated phospholipid phosphatase
MATALQPLSWRGIVTGLNFDTRSNQTILAACCLVYALIAFILAPAAYLQLLAYYFGSTLAVLPVVVLPFYAVAAFLTQPEKPFHHAAAELKQRLLPGAITILLFVLVLSGFTTLKLQIPELIPFFTDQFFADLDKALHGQDPWKLTHAIGQNPVFDAILYFCYSKIWFFQWFGTLLIVAFWHNKQQREQYLWASLLVLITCGTVLAFAMSSAGPIFYDRLYGGERFAELVAYLQTSPGIVNVTKVADYLFYIYTNKTTDLGGGISAMPSVHVAVAVLNAWFFSSLNRWAGIAGWAFAAIIMFGSVYTGWHYALDGYVSFIAATIIWFATRRLYTHFSKSQGNKA